MPVTIEVASFIQPQGELSANFFPDVDLEVMLEGWLGQATTKVLADSDIAVSQHNDAAQAWTYYLAYMYLADSVGNMPNNVSVNNGADQVSYGQDRLTYWLSRASSKQAAYFELADTPVVEVTTRVARSIRTIGIW